MQTSNQAILCFNEGNKFYNAALFTEALAQYEKAVTLNPTFTDAHFCVAKTHIRKKEYEKGIKYFKKYHTLIDKQKLSTYTLAFSNILAGQKQYQKAIQLIDNLGVYFSENQLPKYLPLLLNNGDENKVISLIFKLDNDKKIISEYKKLIENKTLEKSIVEKTISKDIIPRFYTSKNKFKKLSLSGIQNKEYLNLSKETESLINHFQEKKEIDYEKEISTIDNNILKLQEILLKHIEVIAKINKLDHSRKLINILETTKYNSDKAVHVKKIIEQKQKQKNKKAVLNTVITLVSITIIGVVSYFGYKAYEKSSAYKNAINSNSINGYTHYLDRYGKDEKIDKLREKKLYELALKTNNINDFNKLNYLYPNSNKLRSIKILTNIEPDNIEFFGVDDEYDTKQGSTAKVPIGCKIGYKIEKSDKISIIKYLTIIDNLIIQENFKDVKKELLNENFSSNKNGWNVFEESNTVYGRVKNKGVKIDNNELQIFNENRDNKFILSTIKLTKLNKKQDFEIEASISRNEIDNGIFLLFGATKRAFNYIGCDKRGHYTYGYNDWDNNSESWIELSDGWEYSNFINSGNQSTNIIKLTKRKNDINYYINDQYIGSMPLSKWYDNRIGFGINDITKARAHYLKVYQLKNRIKTIFKEGKTYYCWVKELNIRDKPSQKGKILKTIKIGEPVKYLGKSGSKKINATFKEIYSPDYYYKVELVDGSIGWTHGGALKEIPTKNPINFNIYKKNYGH